MRRHNLTVLTRSLLGAILFVVLPAAAHAVQHEVRILMDLDDDPTTGCLVNTVDGPFDGVEQILISTVETTTAPEAATVTDVATSDCVDEVADTFGMAASFDGGWPVGIGNGEGGRDVVETYFPLVSSVVAEPEVVRLGVVVTDELGGEQALLTVDGSPEGEPIRLMAVEPPSVLEIPTLGEWGLILLALLLATASLRLLGRRGTVAFGLVLLVLATGTAWAAVSLDGLIDEWTAADRLASNGIVLFGTATVDELCFRVDVDLLFNQPPTISDVADQSIPEDGTTGALGFTVGDAESAATDLTVTATSSNQVLVPDGNLVLGGSGANRTVEVTPEPNQNGMTDVTLTVQDPDGGTASTTFRVTVTSDNDPPTISAIGDQSILEDSTTGPLAFTVTDVETADGSLTLSGSSSDTTIIPNANIVFGGSGSNRTVTVTPAADQNGGPVTITVTVMDGDGGSVPEQFDVTVTPVNDAPSFSLAGNVSSDEDAGAQVVANHATAISPGPNEGGQTVTFQVTNDNNALFSTQPAIDTAGTLTYESAANANGVATVTVTAMDDGGTANGGVDTSASQMFTITVNAVNDPPTVTSSTISYAAVGNTLLRVPGNDPDHDGGVPGRIASTSDATDAFSKAGPSDPDSATVGFQAGTFATTQGGSLTIDDDGDFHYTPPTGFTGMDDVQVLVEDTEGLTTPVTIELTVSEMVWYVEDTTDATKNPAGGPGTSRNAFETLAAAEAASGAGHFILVFETDSPLDEGITLKAGQKLYGQRVEEEATPLLPGGLLLEEIDDTNALPVIDHTSGDAVTVAATGASLADVEIRHLDLTGSDNAIDVTADAGFDAGVLIRDNELAGGAAALAASTTATAGTMTLQILENIGISATGVGTPGVSVDGSAGGTLLVTAFADNVVNGDTTGHGFFFDTVTFDGDAGAANLQAVAGNATSAGTGGNPVGGSGMLLENVTGDLSFADLDLAADLSGLVVTGTGELTGAAGFRITTGTGSTIVANGGPAVDVDPATVALTLDSITSASSPTTGISLVDVAGSATIGGGSITGSTGNAVHLTSTLANPLDVTYTGTVSNAAGRLLNVDGLPTGSDLLFDGASLSDTGGTGIAVNDFDGVMTVTAATTTITGSTSTGFAATGDTDGTVNLDDVTITDPAGTAVHVVDGGDQIGGTFDFDNVDVSQATNMARLLDVQGLSGGSVNFDAASALSATDGTGVNVSSNAGTSPIVLGGPVDLGTSVSRLSDSTAFTMSGNSAGTSVTALDVDVFTSGQTAVAASGSGVLDMDALSIDTASNGRALDLTGIQSLVDVDSVTCSHNSNCVDLTSLAMSSTTTFAGAALTCTGGTCFNASSARTVEVTGGGNTISATGAVGIDLDTTTIGANDTTWESISASGAANGIVLNSTGTTGQFVVSGDGMTEGSGGLITGTSAEGVLLTDTTASIGWLDISTTGDDGLRAESTDGLTLTRLNLTTLGNADDEFGISLIDVEGTNTFTEVDVTDAEDDAISVASSAAVTLDALTITGGTLNGEAGNTRAGTGIEVIFDNGTATSISIQGVTIEDMDGFALRADANGSAVIGSYVADSVMADNLVSGGASFNASSTASGTFVLTDSQLTNIDNSQGLIANALDSSTNSTVFARNTVSIVNETFFLVSGIALRTGNDLADTPQLNVTVHGNTITDAADGEVLFARAGGNQGRMDLRVTDNNFQASSGAFIQGTFIRSGSGSAGEADTLCLEISGNDSDGDSGFPGIELFQTAGTSFLLETFAGDGTDETAVESFLAAQNPLSSSHEVGNGAVSFTPGAACNTPAVPAP